MYHDEDGDEQFITISLRTNKVGSEARGTYSTGMCIGEWKALDFNEQNDIAKDLFWDYALNDLGEWDFTSGDAS